MSKIEDIKGIVTDWNKKNPSWTDSRLSWDEYFMSLAILASARSSCERLHVGCVIVKDNRVVSMGYNGFLSGAPHESIVMNNHEQATVHAEQNAICDAAKRGVALEGSVAYVTHYPCVICTKLLVSSGIEKIYYSEEYNSDPLSQKLAQQVGVDIVSVKFL